MVADFFCKATKMAELPRSVKAPPVYVEGDSYEEYKRDLEIWQLLKVATAEEEGVIIYRTLTGRAKASCKDLTPAQIGSANGLKEIKKRLDKIYLPELNQRVFVVLDTFEKFKRSGSMTMSNFITEFENLHNTVKTHNITYPDGVLAYRLMKAANISPEHERLCKATVETGKWSYEAVCDQLKKIFSEIPLSPNDNPNSQAIKLENTYLTTNELSQEYCYEEQVNENEHEIFQEDSNPIAQEIFDSVRSDHDIYYGYKYNPNRFRNYGSPQPYKFNTNHKPSFQSPRGYQRFTSNKFDEGRPPTNQEFRSLKAKYNSDPSIPNPKDARGNFTICRRCRSIYHWISECPHNSVERSKGSGTYYSTNINEEIYIALLQSCVPQSETEISSLVTETFNMGVIDSGCTKTVAGENWLRDYLDTLSDSEAARIEYCDSKALFRFGDSEPVSSQKKALIPMKMGGKNIMLATEIVSSDVPLLLSKDTMKAAKAVQNFEKDSITLFGNEQRMICTKSGHYAIPVNPSSEIINESNASKENILLFTTNLSVKETAKKLHQQFGHPSSKRLVSLVKTAGIDDKELFQAINTLNENCDTCKRFKKTPPRPVVTFPLAKEFNEVVALDLKVFENNKTYFLHLIDHATRFSAASVIKSKKPEVIINDFFRIWVSVFGSPKKVLGDNGGEFVNSHFLDMCQNLNINFITTSAESPWSNGLCEKHNGIIGEVVSKILEEINCGVEIALCWAINAKNSLQNIFGFSPYQLVFGRNPNLPSVLNDKLPALEGVTGNLLISNHLNALHRAREEFIKLEASEKLRRAIKAKTRTHNDIRYFPGDEVFFKRENEKRWKGPARVIGQDGSKILIKTPISLISVHSSRVCLTSQCQIERENQPIDENYASQNAEKDDNKINLPDLPDLLEEDELSESGDLGLNSDNQPENLATLNNNNEIMNDQLNNPFNQLATEIDNIRAEGELPVRNEQLNNSSNQLTPEMENMRTGDELPKIHQCVKYRTPGSNDWVNVKILSRAGKATGRYSNWLNMKRLDNEVEYNLDWKKEVSEWEPVAHDVLLAKVKEDKFEDARIKELENWIKMGVYQEVEDRGQQAVTVRWVYKEKVDDQGTTKKARLVARGFEEMNDDILTDSPTCNKDSLRVVIAIIASMEWTINSLDIKAAFLQGKELDREIYLKPPKEAKVKGKLWKLRRCVYGLNDASRYWYMRVKEELIKSGCKCCRADPSVFYYYTDKLEGLLIIHVDDFMFSGTEKFSDQVIIHLKTTFKISKESSSPFKYVGIDVYQNQQGLYLSQEAYTSELEKIDIACSEVGDRNRPVSEEERTMLRKLIGRLNWLSTQTRPDIAYDVSVLSSNVKDATVKDLFEVNKLLMKCKNNNYSLFYPKLDLKNIKIRCYADASFGNLKKGASQGGMFVELVSNNKTSPVMWQSKKIHRVVADVMAAETLAMVSALDEAFLISNMFSELLFQNRETIPIEAVTDSRSLYESAHSTKSLENRRLRIDMSILREYITNEKCQITWVSTSDQLADILTKRGVDNSKLISHISAQ